jgi:hypothetical protein
MDGVRVAGRYPLQFVSGFNLTDPLSATMPSTAGELGDVQVANDVQYIQARTTQSYNSLQNLSRAVLPDDGFIFHAYFRAPTVATANLLRLQLGTTTTFQVEVGVYSSTYGGIHAETLTSNQTEVGCIVVMQWSELQTWTSLSVSCASLNFILQVK